MFERFTEGARQVVVFAQEEARAQRHNYVGTEHLLLGLLREENGVAARVLESFDVTLEEVRAQVHRVVGPGDEPVGGQIPFTPRAKKVLELSLREARARGDAHISTEHVLLALSREGEGVAAQILRDFDVDDGSIRRAVRAAPGGQAPRSAGTASFERDDDGEDQILVELPAARPPLHDRIPLLVAIALAALGFPLGLLIGFLIWG